MIISLIAAMDKNRVIGYRNRIPWDLSSDQQHFKAITLGHPVIVGRKTFESMGRALPGRKNIILSRQRGYRAEGALVVHSLEDAFRECANGDEVFICGGGTVYHETIGRADRIYLTVIDAEYPGDVFFPEIPDSFAERAREEIKNMPPYTFVQYERKS